MGDVVYGTDFRRHLDARKAAKSDAEAIVRGLCIDADTAPCEYVLDGGETVNCADMPTVWPSYQAPAEDPA